MKPDAASNLHRRTGPTRRGFTIAELVVAIGLTVVLILGISRIFTIAKDTVSIGSSTSQLAEAGRAIERLIRKDFDGLTRRDGVLVIRNEQLGDGARSSANDRPVYVDTEARSRNEDLGLRRLDSLTFVSIGDYSSNQYRPGSQNIARNDSSQTAIITYGHGLRVPKLVPQDIDDRSWPADFEIKTGAGAAAYRAAFADSRGIDEQNYFAKDWILARKANLLSPKPEEPGSWTLNWVPSPFEYYNEAGGAYFSNTDYFRWPGYNPGDPQNYFVNRLSTGYADIIDLDLIGLKKAITEYGSLLNLQTGKIENRTDDLRPPVPNDPIGDEYGFVNWKVDRFVPEPDAFPQEVWSRRWLLGQVLRMIALTGRVRVEPSAPSVLRDDQMLTHATLAVGCSNFEVAWSTGEVTYPDGELVWYDINNPADPDAVRFDIDLYTEPADPLIYQLSEYYSNLLPSSGALAEPQRDDLYYATFGYFVPQKIVGPQLQNSFGEIDDRSLDWPWPKMLRIRMTLHDQTNRVKGGRVFEFIMNLPAPTQQ